MKQTIFTISLSLILAIVFGCNPALFNIKFDCTYSNNETIKTKEEAVAIANYYLEQNSERNYYKDSVSVSINEDGNFYVSFKLKDIIIPDNIMLIVRKNDGCVAPLIQE